MLRERAGWAALRVAGAWAYYVRLRRGSCPEAALGSAELCSGATPKSPGSRAKRSWKPAEVDRMNTRKRAIRAVQPATTDDISVSRRVASKQR